jgi:hypothetical protein
MGLLDKYNPHATRRSATAWAVGVGVVFGLFGFLGWLLSDMPFGALFFIVPWMVAVGALTGWSTEWQTPPEDDSDAEPGATPDPARDIGPGSS